MILQAYFPLQSEGEVSRCFRDVTFILRGLTSHPPLHVFKHNYFLLLSCGGVSRYICGEECWLLESLPNLHFFGGVTYSFLEVLTSHPTFEYFIFVFYGELP